MKGIGNMAYKIIVFCILFHKDDEYFSNLYVIVLLIKTREVHTRH